MIITTGKSRRDTKWKAEDIGWAELCSRLGSPVRTRETCREYRAMSREQQGAVKDIGGFVGGRLYGQRRCREAVADRCLVTLDADNAKPDTWDDVAAVWEGAMCCYSTHSSTPEKPRLRFVIPLNRAVTPEEYPAIARKLASRIGLETMDSSTYDVSRLMYWPSCPMDGVPFFGVLEGEPTDADAVLREYGLGEAWRDTTLWPLGKGEQEIVVTESRRQGDPEEKPGMVGLFCRAYDIPAAIDTFLPDVYEPAGEGRYTYRAGSTVGGAVLYDGGRFLYSHHGTDPCGGRLVNAFDLVRIHKFRELDGGREETPGAGERSDVTKLPSYRKMLEFAAQQDAVKLRTAEERSRCLEGMLDGGEADRDAGDTDGTDETYMTDAEAGDNTGWERELTLDKSGSIEPTPGNLLRILRNDPEVRGVFAFNRLSGELVRLRPCAWNRKAVRSRRDGDVWTDVDDARLRVYIETRWGIDFPRKLDDAVEIVANDCAFDPLQDYLNGLVWDGEDRLDTMLVRWMGAEDTPFVRAATRKWMCGAVARALVPGCKFDNMLVLTGAQGIGKSELGRQLSKGWFTDSIDKLGNGKDAQDAVGGVWIAEIAELSGMRKAEVEDVKNYISKQDDRFRRAYARRKSVTLRRCVFYGTTNDLDFLRDRTGNRRFWPVEVRGIGHGERVKHELGAEVDQLWAEAVVRYRGGETLWMDGELARLAEEAQAAHTEIGEYEMVRERVLEYLDKPLPADWETRDKYQRRAYYEQDGALTDLGRESGMSVPRERFLHREILWELFGEESTRARSNTAVMVGRVMQSVPGWKRVHMNTGTGYKRATPLAPAPGWECVSTKDGTRYRRIN